ncbi:MAG: PQQ-binding-like beta-propeller repeat protein [Bryobacteraceae bacterium]
MSRSLSNKPAKRNIRWWPAAALLFLAGAAILWVRAKTNWSFQERNIQTLSVLAGAFVLVLLWWLTASRAPRRVRLLVTGIFAFAAGITLTVFQIHGVSGDLRPVLEFRWARPLALRTPSQTGTVPEATVGTALDFPQFLGPHRTAILQGSALDRDWGAKPPRVLWRQPIGAGWSGWAIVGARAFTQEQRPEGECVTCYDALTGHLLWLHAEPAHYQNALAGEGPRCTPTVLSNRVFALGASGILQCLDATTGKRLWSHNIVNDALSRVPEWGFSGSPLLFAGRVIVSAGGSSGRSLLAYDSETGKLAWSAGGQWISYSSPFLATLSGVQQILAFNSRKLSAHDAVSGQVLWEYPWGRGEPQVAVPVVTGTNRVLFSSGYGVGSELLEIAPAADGHLMARRVWKSTKMKAKFANLVQREGFLYGLDDGVLACLDLKDGSQRWKAGRYGHGQGLLINDLYLLMAESGELVLLQPTPEAPNELHRFRVFSGKTWNPIAFSGGLVLARTDREAACLRIPTL